MLRRDDIPNALGHFPSDNHTLLLQLLDVTQPSASSRDSMPSLFSRLGGTSRRPQITVEANSDTLRRKLGLIRSTHSVICTRATSAGPKTAATRAQHYAPRAPMLHLTATAAFPVI